MNTKIREKIPFGFFTSQGINSAEVNRSRNMDPGTAKKQSIYIFKKILVFLRKTLKFS
jgi:hypothetical protein